MCVLVFWCTLYLVLNTMRQANEKQQQNLHRKSCFFFIDRATVWFVFRGWKTGVTEGRLRDAARVKDASVSAAVQKSSKIWPFKRGAGVDVGGSQIRRARSKKGRRGRFCYLKGEKPIEHFSVPLFNPPRYRTLVRGGEAALHE